MGDVLDITKVASIVVISSMAATTSQAAAPYLFGLTQSDINSIQSNYPNQITIDEVEEIFQAPLNCGTYGDLCDVLGTAGAETFLESIADRALAADDFSSTSVMTALSSEFKYLEELHNAPSTADELFADDPFWGGAVPTDGGGNYVPQSCVIGPVGLYDDDETNDFTFGNTIRVQTKAFATKTVFYNNIGTTARQWIREQSEDTFFRDRDSDITLDGLFYAAKDGGCCADESDTGKGTVYVMKESSFSSPWAYYVLGQQHVAGATMGYNYAEHVDDPGYSPGRCGWAN